MQLADRFGDDTIQFVLGRQPAGQFPPSWDVGLVGICVGELVGDRVGVAIGNAVGTAVGTGAGASDGAADGVSDGAGIGTGVGTSDGTTVGSGVGVAMQQSTPSTCEALTKAHDAELMIIVDESPKTPSLQPLPVPQVVPQHTGSSH